MALEKFIFTDDVATHMPFVAQDKMGTELFCRKNEAGNWKAHYRDSAGNIQRLFPTLPDSYNECNPTMYMDDGVETRCVVATEVSSGNPYMLYCARAPLFEPIPICPAASGFLYKDMQATWFASVLSVVDDGVETKYRLPNINGLYKLVYDVYNPRVLFLSGTNQDHTPFAWIYVPHQYKLYSLHLEDGSEPYKFVIYRDTCYYAIKTGEDFEDRKIAQTKHYYIEELPLTGNIEELSTEKVVATELEDI